MPFMRNTAKLLYMAAIICWSLDVHAAELMGDLPIKNLVGNFPNVAPENRFTDNKAAAIWPRWLNDHEVIFSITEVEDPKASLADGQNQRVVTWDTNTGKLTKHGKGYVRCVNSTDGYVQIIAKVVGKGGTVGGTPEQITTMQGHWDKGDLQIHDLPWKVGFGNISQLTCRETNDGPLHVTLNDGHGWLERQHNRAYPMQGGKWLYENPDKSIKTEFSYGSDESTYIRYLPFRKAYFLYNTVHMTAHTDINTRRKVQILELDGQAIDIPTPDPLWQWARKDIPQQGYGALASLRELAFDKKPKPGVGSVSIYPGVSKLGVMWTVSQPDTHSAFDRALDVRPGCYLQRDRVLYKIMKGSCGDVSPNGCKVIQKKIINELSFSEREVEFEVQDLCKGEALIK